MSKIALVTGGQQGIGLGITKKLIASGFRVAIASRSSPDSPKISSVLSELGDGARYFHHDVSDIERIPELLSLVECNLGPVTCLVNNAGVGSPVRGDMLELDAQNWDHVLNINLKGLFFLSQAVARRMLNHNREHYRSIIFVTSVSASMVSIERAEYCVSKAAAAMVSELFAVRLAEEGIGVFELRPGIIATEMTAAVEDKYTPRIAAGLVPARRWGVAEDVGEIAEAIAMGRLSFAQGAVIPVDGGLSISRL